MKQSLQLKLGQQLAMTPQLQQAIRLLQLSSLELSIEVQQVLDSNMMLELEDDSELPDLGLDSLSSDTTTSEDLDGSREDWNGDGNAPEGGRESPEDWDSGVASTTEDIPQDLPIDIDWEDVFDSTLPQGAPQAPQEDYGDRESQVGTTETLREHLLWQLNLAPLSAADRKIGEAIIDAINEDGYLEATVEEIRDIVSVGEPQPFLSEEVTAVLRLVQMLEPAGVGARDLKECLLLQLKQLPPETPWREEARTLCEHHLTLLASRDYAQLGRRLDLATDDLRAVIALIRSLAPRPGGGFSATNPEYLIPDVFVRKIKGRWRVELNGETMPQLRINPYYANLVRRAANTDDNNALRTHLQEAKWFIKSLQSRSETLLRVANAIVERQRAFLEHGEEAMRPLILHDIADALGMHESTISRVTTRKYLYTPRGTFELKYFFSSHVGTSLGGEASSTAIRAVIRKLISAENGDKPLSDSIIASILSKQGVNVARRTVAKYREGMQIPPSNERKKLV